MKTAENTTNVPKEKFTYVVWWMVFTINIVFIHEYTGDIFQLVSMMLIVLSCFFIGIQSKEIFEKEETA